MPQTDDSASESENIRPDEAEQMAERPQSLPIPETNQEKLLEEHDSKGAMAQGEDGTFECEECGVEEAAPAGIHITPSQPAQAQVEECRDSQHIPYRSWCPWCVKARAVGEQHRKRPDASGVQVFAFDYLIITRTGAVVLGEGPWGQGFKREGCVHPCGAHQGRD